MVIVLTDDGPVLEAPEDCKKFHVEVRGSGELGAAGRFDDDGEHALIEIDWVRQAAAGRVPDDWTEQFDGMLAYAGTKGWIEGTTIKGHIER